jgi:hypothetical protein
MAGLTDKDAPCDTLGCQVSAVRCSQTCMTVVGAVSGQGDLDRAEPRCLQAIDIKLLAGVCRLLIANYLLHLQVCRLLIANYLPVSAGY